MMKLPGEVTQRAGEGDTDPAATKVAPRAFCLLTALLLTACATPSEPRVVVKEVQVPIPVACATAPPPEQPFSDTPEALRAAGDLFEKVKLLLAGRAQRDARLYELRASVAGCS